MRDYRLHPQNDRDAPRAEGARWPVRRHGLSVTTARTVGPSVCAR